MTYRPLLIGLLLLTGCAGAGVCPDGAIHQQFKEQSSEMTISRCRVGRKNVGPFQRLVAQKPRLVGQYTKTGQRTGQWLRYDEQGKVVHQFAYDQHGQLHGDERFFIKGALRTHVRWVHGKKQGKSCLYHTNGKKKSCGQFVDDQAHGPWPVWSRRGKLLFTNNYTHGFAHEHMFYGHKYYTMSVKKADGTILSKTYQHPSHKLLKSVAYQRCGVGWCRKAYKSYFQRDKKGKLTISDRPIEHITFDWQRYTATNQKTQQSTTMFCNESQFAPLIKKFHNELSTCTRHSPPTMQRLAIGFAISDQLSIHNTRILYNAEGTQPALKRCVQRQLKRRHSPSIDIKKGVCRIRLNMLTTSPQSFQYIPDFQRAPSH